MRLILQITILSGLPLAIVLSSYSHSMIKTILLLIAWLLFLFIIDIIQRKRLFHKKQLINIRESDCCCELSLHISLNELLKDPIFDTIYESLCNWKNEYNSFKFESKGEWIDCILSNYRKKEVNMKWCGTVYSNYRVKFKINNLVLWKNNEMQLTRILCDLLSIPYFEQRLTGLGLDTSLHIFLVVTNGMLKLQVGNFPKEISPSIIDNRTFKEYHTITTFPLMYLTQDIPPRYLNFSIWSLDFVVGRFSKQVRNEWRQISKDREIYESSYIKGTCQAKKLWSKGKDILEKQGFSWLDSNLYNYSVNYSNKILSVHFKNYDLEDRETQGLGAEYTEERDLI